MRGVEKKRLRVAGWKPFFILVDGVGRREGRLLVLRDEDGRVGVGECSPLPGWSRESLAEVDSFLFGGEQGEEEEWGEGLEERAAEKRLPSSLQFAWDCAEADLNGFDFGSAVSNSLVINALLVRGAGGVEGVAARAREVYRDGGRVFKIKTTGFSGEEMEVVLGILREEFGGGVQLRLDSNRCLEWEDAVALLRRVEGFAVSYWEEPLRDAARLREWIAWSPIPVGLDETLREIPLGMLAEYRGAAAAVLKPSLQGGLRVAKEWADEAARWGMRAVVSAAYESGWGIYWLGQFACRLGGAEAAGLDTYSFVREDILRDRLDLSGYRFDSRMAKPVFGEAVGEICWRGVER